ncbi:MAG TPA: HEAT repeat domain-containing protein, partial [Ktedonobacterales bacterium]|nr:HEAT repeat domain-containing protein [Ktedonobacterales bacterium]
MPLFVLLTPNPLDLSYLKRQAKRLLDAFRAADPQAQSRVATQLPRFAGSGASRRPLQLADALCVVAREAGFTSWPRLKAYVLAQAQNAQIASPESGQESGQEALREKSNRRVSVSAVSALRIAALVDLLISLAKHGDAEALAREFSHLPRRDTLAARTQIVERGAQATLVDTLLIGLHHPQARVRFDCTHALDHFADDRCVEPLRRLLSDPVPRVRWMATHVLSCEACKLTPLPTD